MLLRMYLSVDCQSRKNEDVFCSSLAYETCIHPTLAVVARINRTVHHYKSIDTVGIIFVNMYTTNT